MMRLPEGVDYGYKDGIPGLYDEKGRLIKKAEDLTPQQLSDFERDYKKRRGSAQINVDKQVQQLEKQKQTKAREDAKKKAEEAAKRKAEADARANQQNQSGRSSPPAAPPAAPSGRSTPPAAPSAPGRSTAPAPQASPVAAYMKAAAAARKSGDPAEMARVRDMGLQIWRSTPANKKLAAAAAERERTRGTSATTNPLMTDMKDRLPAPKPTQPETDASTRSRQTAQAMGMSATARNLAGPAAVPTAVPNLATTAPAAAPARAATPAAAPKPGEFSASNTSTNIGNKIGYDPNTKLKGLYQMSTTSNINYTGKEKPVELKKPVPLKQSYEYEPYDLVLEYLLSEGHADTVDEAHYVMMQMSAKHIQNIIEDVYTGPIRQERPQPKVERGERRVPLAPGSSFGPGYERNNKPKVPSRTPPANPGRGEGGTGLPPGVLPPNVERYTRG